MVSYPSPQVMVTYWNKVFVHLLSRVLQPTSIFLRRDLFSPPSGFVDSSTHTGHAHTNLFWHIETTKRVLQEGRGPDGLRKDNFICQLLVCQRNAVLGGGNAMQLPKWRKRQKLRICPTEGVSKDCKGKAGWCCLHNVHRTQKQLHKNHKCKHIRLREDCKGKEKLDVVACALQTAQQALYAWCSG